MDHSESHETLRCRPPHDRGIVRRGGRRSRARSALRPRPARSVHRARVRRHHVRSAWRRDADTRHATAPPHPGRAHRERRRPCRRSVGGDAGRGQHRQRRPDRTRRTRVRSAGPQCRTPHCAPRHRPADGAWQRARGSSGTIGTSRLGETAAPDQHPPAVHGHPPVPQVVVAFVITGTFGATVLQLEVLYPRSATMHRAGFSACSPHSGSAQ
jgi:hypothetical protein